MCARGGAGSSWHAGHALLLHSFLRVGSPVPRQLMRKRRDRHTAPNAAGDATGEEATAQMNPEKETKSAVADVTVSH